MIANNIGKSQKDTIPTENRIRQSFVITIICDFALILALAICLLVYVSKNSVNTYNQNVENIADITSAKSELLQAALVNTGNEIKGAYRYCRNKGVTEILDYLSLTCGKNDEYQLLKYNETDSTDLYHIYCGYSTKKTEGNYQPVEYSDTALSSSIQKYAAQEEGEVFFSQIFTNKTDGMRYFALVCAIPVDDNGESLKYYLVKPQKESSVLDRLQLFSQYSDVSLAVCYPDGKYLAYDNGFRDDNFYDYIYKYNALSMDEKNELRDSIQNDDDGAGTLSYRDYKGRECIFSYVTCGEPEKWNVIVSVPLSEFVSEQLISFFPAIVIAFLTIILIFNIWRLLVLVRELKFSVEREQIANTAKSSFLSRMSHEIRTPLNAVIGYNSIAKNEITGADSKSDRRQAMMRVMDCLEKSEVASKHLLGVINDVLDMSAIESGKITVDNERFDFKGLITSLTTVFYSQAKAKGVDFKVIFHTLTEEWFVGDQMRTKQILTNLLSNAVKFTPEGGLVTLKIFQPEAETNAQHIHFEISDTGIGMTSEYLEHIWTPFEQEDLSISRRFGGTGLGLSITKNLVDIMGGTITVKSVQGEGTTFNVDLTFEKSEQTRNDELYNFKSVNALVVDDDISTCNYIRMLFNRCGAKCTAVTSGADALKAFAVAAEQGNGFTMCLIDWQMPEMDGIETIRQLKRISYDAGGDENMPIIILTAYDFTEVAEKACEVGVNKYISKPFFQSTLFDLLATQSGINAQIPAEENMSNKDLKKKFNGLRILLTEDNEMNMEIAKKILVSEGFIVDGAWNGKEAVDIFEASPPGTYAAVLMDIHMPIMSGHEATQAIRASSHPEAKTIPVIAMTADAFTENVAEAHASGMDAHIAKPLDFKSLFETLNKYIHPSEQ